MTLCGIVKIVIDITHWKAMICASAENNTEVYYDYEKNGPQLFDMAKR